MGSTMCKLASSRAFGRHPQEPFGGDVWRETWMMGSLGAVYDGWLWVIVGCIQNIPLGISSWPCPCDMVY